MKPLKIPAGVDASLDPNDPKRYFKTEHLKTDLKGRTVRGGITTMAAEGLRQILFLVSTVVLARLLTPADNGLVAMVLVVTGFLEWFKDLGLSAATIQRAEISQRQVSTLFWINVAAGFSLALLTIALAPVIAWFYGEPRVLWITIALAFGFVFTSPMLQHQALLKRQMHFTLLAVIAVVLTAVETTVGIAAAMAGFGYWSLVLMRLVSGPLELLILWLVCPWRPGRPGPVSEVRSMLAFGGNLTGSRLLLYLTRNVDNLLIGRAYGPVQLGLYTKAYTLLLLPLNQINHPISAVALPALSRLVDSPQRYRDAYTSIVSKVCLLSMPLVAFMISTSDWIVLAALGPQWIGASTIFAWLGISALIEPFTGTLWWLFYTQNRTHEQLRWGVLNAGLMILGFVVGLPWGPIGVAAAYGLVSLGIRTPLLCWVVGRSGPVRTSDLYRSVVPVLLSACGVVLAITAFRWWIDIQNPFLGLAITALITPVVSFLVLAILPSGRPILHDLRSIFPLLPQRKPSA